MLLVFLWCLLAKLCLGSPSFPGKFTEKPAGMCPGTKRAHCHRMWRFLEFCLRCKWPPQPPANPWRQLVFVRARWVAASSLSQSPQEAELEREAWCPRTPTCLSSQGSRTSTSSRHQLVTQAVWTVTWTQSIWLTFGVLWTTTCIHLSFFFLFLFLKFEPGSQCVALARLKHRLPLGLRSAPRAQRIHTC